MAEFKLVMSDLKTGKSYQKEANDAEAGAFLGKKIGEKINGEAIGLTGYEFEITGGSDNCGFPMRRDVDGTMRKKVLIVEGFAFRKGRKGERRRVNAAGNTVNEKTAQLNLKVVKEGAKKLEELFGKKEEKKAEEKPKEEKKEETKKEEKPKEAPKEKKKEVKEEKNEVKGG